MPTSEDLTQDQGQTQPSVDTAGQTPNFKESCFQVRDALEPLKREVLILKTHWCFVADENFTGQHGEMKANIMLAYRHLEDARMRMGKAIQAYDGKDCLPR